MTSAERAEVLFNNGLEVVDVAINLGALDTIANWPARCADDTAAIAREIGAAVAEALAARWVPVTERLPEPGVIVLVTLGDTCVCCAYHVDSGWRWTKANLAVEVIAWQPLPAPWVAP